jgi:hypothetical protein
MVRRVKEDVLLASYTRLSTSASSAALRVQISSSLAHLRTLVRLVRLTPSGIGRSQRYRLKAGAENLTDTSATCELSIAWRTIPSSLHSKFASVTSSLMAVGGC